MTKQTTIIRCPRSGDIPYFIMSRALAQDRTISLEARGVMAYLLSKPDDWKVQPSDLEQLCGSNRVYRILKELKDAGYMELKQQRDGQRISGWVYEVHESPLLHENQHVGQQEVENLRVENSDLTNKRVSQNKDSDREESKDNSPEGESAPAKPEKKPRKPHKNAPWHDGLVEAFGHANGNMTPTLDKSFWKVAAELSAVQFPVESIPALYSYVKARAQREKWNSFSVNALAKYAPDFLKTQPANGSRDSYKPVYTMSAEDAKASEAEAMRMLAEAKRRALEAKGLPHE
jgi:hypothetical protein